MKKFKGENIEKIRFTDNYIVEIVQSKEVTQLLLLLREAIIGK